MSPRAETERQRRIQPALKRLVQFASLLHVDSLLQAHPSVMQGSCRRFAHFRGQILVPILFNLLDFPCILFSCFVSIA